MIDFEFGGNIIIIYIHHRITIQSGTCHGRAHKGQKQFSDDEEQIGLIYVIYWRITLAQGIT